MHISISLETKPPIIKDDYKFSIEYQGKQLESKDNIYTFYIHTIHERLFEKITVKFKTNWWKVIGASFFGEIRIHELIHGINYIPIFPGSYYGKYLNYNHIKEQIGISTVFCTIKGNRNAEIPIIYSQKNFVDKMFSVIDNDKKKKFLFFLYQTKQIFEGTNFCNLNVLKGIYLLQKIFYNKNYLDNSRYNRSSYIEMNIEFIKNYQNLLYYAIAPYGKFLTITIPKRCLVKDDKINDTRKRILEFLNIPDKDLIGVYINENKPSHIIFKVNKTLYVSFRGTETLNEVSHDVYTKYCTFKNGFIHEGIKDLAYAFYNKYNKLLIEIFNEHKCEELIFVGHSLGGSLSIMAGILFKHLIQNLKVYAFSPAPFLTENVLKELNCKDYIISIINGDDVFPRLSLGSLMDLKYISSSIGSNINLLQRNNFKELLDFFNEIKVYLISNKKFMKLYLPGKLFHMKKFPLTDSYLKGASFLKRTNLIKYKSTVLFKEVEFDFFNEIVVSGGFYSDHILQNFLDSFVIAQQKYIEK